MKYQVQILMSRSQAPGQTTHGEQNLSGSILGNANVRFINFQTVAHLPELISKAFNLSNIETPKTWILLDIQSTAHLFWNKFLVHNVIVGGVTMAVHCNEGNSHINLVVNIPLLKKYVVCFQSQGIFNMTSMSQVIKHYPVTYDSHEIIH